MHAVVLFLMMGLNGWRFDVGPAVGEYSRWTVVQAGVSYLFPGKEYANGALVRRGLVAGINAPLLPAPHNETGYMNGDFHVHYEWLWALSSRDKPVFVVMGAGFGPYLRVTYENPPRHKAISTMRVGFPSFRLSLGVTLQRFVLEFFWYRVISGRPNFVGLSIRPVGPQQP